MKPINIADVLRFVNQETGFLKHFEHVRQVQSGQSDHLNDLLAAVIGNGTYYGSVANSPIALKILKTVFDLRS